MRRVLVVAVALVMSTQAGSARAAIVHSVDDNCSVSGSGTYQWVAMWNGGPVTGWYIHHGSGFGGCHLYTWTDGTALPVSYAAYALPPTAAYNGYYQTDWLINCEHNAPKYKFYHMTQGSSGGVQGITTTGTHLPCGAVINLTASRNYCATCGGSIRLVDNVPVAAEPQNADLMRFDP